MKLKALKIFGWCGTGSGAARQPRVSTSTPVHGVGYMGSKYPRYMESYMESKYPSYMGRNPLPQAVERYRR